jgi:hypothetical protein
VEVLKQKLAENTLRFKLEETLEGIQEKIAQDMLRLIEMDWTQHVNENSRYFTTKLDDLKIEVKEDEVKFTRENIQTNEGLITETKDIRQEGGDGKRFKSLLHQKLCKRFDDDDNINFYKEVLRTLMDHVDIDEDVRPEEGENNGPVYLREHKK